MVNENKKDSSILVIRTFVDGKEIEITEKKKHIIRIFIPKNTPKYNLIGYLWSNDVNEGYFHIKINDINYHLNSEIDTEPYIKYDIYVQQHSYNTENKTFYQEHKNNPLFINISLSENRNNPLIVKNVNEGDIEKQKDVIIELINKYIGDRKNENEKEYIGKYNAIIEEGNKVKKSKEVCPATTDEGGKIKTYLTTTYTDPIAQKRAYFAASKSGHPDKNPECEGTATEIFKIINAKYEKYNKQGGGKKIKKTRKIKKRNTMKKYYKHKNKYKLTKKRYGNNKNPKYTKRRRHYK